MQRVGALSKVSGAMWFGFQFALGVMLAIALVCLLPALLGAAYSLLKSAWAFLGSCEARIGSTIRRLARVE